MTEPKFTITITTPSLTIEQVASFAEHVAQWLEEQKAKVAGPVVVEQEESK